MPTVQALGNEKGAADRGKAVADPPPDGDQCQQISTLQLFSLLFLGVLLLSQGWCPALYSDSDFTLDTYCIPSICARHSILFENMIFNGCTYFFTL